MLEDQRPHLNILSVDTTRGVYNLNGIPGIFISLEGKTVNHGKLINLGIF